MRISLMTTVLEVPGSTEHLCGLDMAWPMLARTRQETADWPIAGPTSQDSTQPTFHIHFPPPAQLQACLNQLERATK